MALVPNSSVDLGPKVRDVLASAGGSVTNQLSTFFKPEAKINMWSRYKPTHYPADFPDQELQCKGVNGDYGISIPFVSSYTSLYNLYDGNLNGWKYTLPSGGSGSPYRLGDFRRYCSHANSPIYSWDFTPSETNTSDLNIEFQFRAHFTTQNNDGYGLSLSDLSSLSSKYLGIMAFKQGATTANGYVTFDKPIKQMDVVTASMTINLAGLGEGTFYIYPIIATNAQTSFGGSTSNSWTLFPGEKKRLLVGAAYGTAMAVDAFVGDSTGDLYYNAVFRAGTSGAHTFSGAKLQFRASGTGIAQATIGTISLAAGKTTVKSGTIARSTTAISKDQMIQYAQNGVLTVELSAAQETTATNTVSIRPE